MTTTIGTCSRCGGPVQVPALWGGIVPPTPRCARCGAVAPSHGPVIETQPEPWIKTLDDREVSLGDPGESAVSLGD